MKNLLKLSLLSILFLFLITTYVFAATVTNSKPVVVSTVSITNTEIYSQKGNVFNISFSFSNREGLQTGVKYGVLLVKNNPDGSQYVVDQKIYDDSLTINPNSLINKSISYEAPSFLDGKYTLFIKSGNANGFPFGIVPLGEVSLHSTNGGVQILPETCSLHVVGENNGKEYSLIQGVDIKPEENLSLTCTIENSFKTDISATPRYETKSGSFFGEVVGQVGGDIKNVSIKAGEKKSLSFVLPKASTPGIYNIGFYLYNNKEGNSNIINISYFLKGISVSIQNVSLDKDYYNKGNKAQVSFFYLPSRDSFPGARFSSEVLPASVALIQISNDKGKACADIMTDDLSTQNSPKVDISIPISSFCINPIVGVTLKDKNGTILDQKDFKVKTSSAIANSNKMSTEIIIIVIILLAIIAVFIFMKKKNKINDVPPTNPTDNIITMGIIFFLMIFSIFSFLPVKKASADEIYWMNGFLDVSIGPHTGTSGDVYTIGKTITAYATYNPVYSTGNSIVTVGAINDTNSVAMLPDIFKIKKAYALLDNAPGSLPTGYSVIFSGSVNSILSGSTSFTVPSNPGTYSIKFSDSIGEIYHFLYIVQDPYVPPATVPTVIVSSDKSTIPSGGNVNIHWASTNATNCSCTYSGGACGTGVGSYVIASNNPYTLAQSTTFTVTCNDNAPTGTVKACYQGFWDYPDPVHPDGGYVNYTDINGISQSNTGIWHNDPYLTTIYYKQGTTVTHGGVGTATCQ